MGQDINSKNKGVDIDMKNIRKRNDGRWEFRKVVNGTRISISSRTLETLKKKKKEYLQTQNKLNNSTKLFKDYVNEWFNLYKKNLAPKTLESYNNTLNNYILKNFGEKRLSQLNTVEIQSFINTIKAKRVKELVLIHFKSILKFLYAQGLLKIDIAQLINFQKPINEQQATSKRPLTISQQKQLLNTLQKCNQELKLFILFSIILGTRRQETLKFKITDIDEHNNLIIHGTKTKQSLRTIKISNSMIELLKQKQIDNQSLYFNFTLDNATKSVNKILQKIDPSLTLHCLRKTCSTNMHYLGISDKIRQQVLGHTSIRTTNDIYTYLEFDIKKEDILELYNTLYYQY